MKYAGLFDGIGGFSLAAQWMGWEHVFHCEKKSLPARYLNITGLKR